LRDRTFTAWLADVPNFDTTFAAGINIFGRITDGDRTNDLSMAKSINLPGVSRYTRPDQSVRWKWHRLDLTVSADVKRIGRLSTGDEAWST